MAFFKRIFFFLAVNLAMMLTISFVLSLLGVGRYLTPYGIDYGSLAAFCFVWGMAGAFISLFISKWMVKWQMGVQIIEPNAPGPYLELVETVHNLARAANLPAMPEVGIYDSPEVNAFATGPSKSNSLVAVSTGLLRSMNKNEVVGVLGHEVAHIANGDMVTLTLIQGIVNSFVMFLSRIAAFALSQALSSRNDDRDGRSSYMGNHLFVFLFEIIFGMIGAMIVAYFSRMREFRADAGGANYAGRDNMRAALVRLMNNQGRIDDSQPAMAAMKISGHPSGFLALFSTHPPLEERIHRLESR